MKYYIVVDQLKNTKLVPITSASLDIIFANRGEVKHHKTRRDLYNEINNFLNTGGQSDETS